MNVFKRVCAISAFHRELGANRDRLYRLAMSWCADPDTADDLVQETMAKALRHRYQLRDSGATRTWLFRILHNCWCDHLRRQKPTTDLDTVVLSHELTPEKLHDAATLVDRVRDAVAELPAGQRQALTLVDLEGCSYADVAAILDIPIGTVMSRICRARRALGERLMDFAPATEKQALRRVK